MRERGSAAFRHRHAPRRLACALVMLAGCARDGENGTTLAADSATELTLADVGTAAGDTSASITLGGDTALGTPTADIGVAPALEASARGTVAAASAPSVAVPQRMLPAAATEAPAEPAAPVAAPTVAAGTVLALASDTRLCLNDATPGTRVAASVREAARGSDGATIPAGASVVLAVASRQGGELRLTAKAIDIDGISYPMQGTVVGSAPLDTARVSQKKRGAWGAVAGAAAGAAVGAVVGRDAKGAAIGAGAGAAIGATAGAVTAPTSICLVAGAPLQLSLSAPLRLRAQ